MPVSRTAIRISGLPTVICHDFSIITQYPGGQFVGTGEYTVDPPGWTWVVSGELSNSDVSMIIDYDQEVGGEDYSVSLTGTMSDCDTMSGTATDSKGNDFNWTATRAP